VNLQSPVGANETQFPEPIHNETDSRAGCSEHFGQCLLADFGSVGFGFALISMVCDQQKRAGQPLFAGVEKLIDQVRFNSNIAPTRPWDYPRSAESLAFWPPWHPPDMPRYVYSEKETVPFRPVIFLKTYLWQVNGQSESGDNEFHTLLV